MRIDIDALFAASPSPYVLLDCELRIVWANAAYLETTGRAREALIGVRMTDAFPAPAESQSEQMLQASFRKVIATARQDYLPWIPYPIETADGQTEDRYWSATHTPIADANGRVEYILQNTMDVTDLYHEASTAREKINFEQAAMMQRAKAVATENLALGTMTEFIRSAFDQAPSFMAIVYGPQHVFQIVNQSYTDLIGGREVIGKTVREALPDLDGQGFYELLDRAYTTGEPISVKGMSAMLQHGDDEKPTQRFIDFIYHPLKDENGASIGIIAQGHEVTGQKVAEAELSVTREKFRTMAQTMPAHVWTAEKDGGLNWLNDPLYAFTGHKEGELYGADWATVLHPDDLDGAVEKWIDAIERRVSYETEFRIRKYDGTYRWHLVRASPLSSATGELVGWVGTNTDIEDRKFGEEQIARMNETLEARVAMRNQELEELYATLRQSQKLEAIGGLAGGIAHDFNNLLQVMTGNLELATRELPQDAPIQKRLDQAMKAVSRGATLASQLLSFARKQPLSPVVVDLSQLLNDTSDILHSAIGEGVGVETRFADGLWNTHIDPSSMENALLNLAINARDAMDGHGTLTISVENADIDQARADKHPGLAVGQYVSVAVSDTGSGISAEDMERIFEPFFTTKEDGHGTGLGMSMVYGFAKQSGGHVTIESTLGEGTTIKIYLPRSLEDAQDLSTLPDAGLSGGTETILLVEDDSEVRETAYRMLRNLGYEVLTAPDARAALAIIEDDVTIDLLFTDVIMPGNMTGHELAEIARARRPELPVLFTSGYVQDEIVHDGRLDEGVQLLGKPYTQKTLAQKLRVVLAMDGVTVPPPAMVTPLPAEATAKPDTIDFNGLRVLVCEDDVLIRMDIAQGLSDAGCVVLETGTAAKTLEVLGAETVDLLITDVGLPDKSGEDLAADVRGIHPALPIIFATGGVEVATAPILGNCTLLSKPFRDTEMLDSITALITAQ